MCAPATHCVMAIMMMMIMTMMPLNAAYSYTYCSLAQTQRLVSSSPRRRYDNRFTRVVALQLNLRYSLCRSLHLKTLDNAMTTKESLCSRSV